MTEKDMNISFLGKKSEMTHTNVFCFCTSPLLFGCGVTA